MQQRLMKCSPDPFAHHGNTRNLHFFPSFAVRLGPCDQVLAKGTYQLMVTASSKVDVKHPTQSPTFYIFAHQLGKAGDPVADTKTTLGNRETKG